MPMNDIKLCPRRHAVSLCLLFAALPFAMIWLLAGTALAADAGAKTIQALGGAPPAGTTRIGFGTAFFVDAEGDLVTADHVVNSCRQVRIAAPDLAAVDADVRVLDHPHDLALLHVNEVRPGGLEMERLPPFDTAAASEGVLLLSDPKASPKLDAISGLGEGLEDVGFPGLASASPVTLPMKPLGIAVASSHDWRIFLQGGAMPGQSGSPVLNRQGKVVGMFSQAVLRPGHTAVTVPDLGQAWDAALVVPATMISQFLTAHVAHAARSPGAALAGPGATVKVFCFM